MIIIPGDVRLGGGRFGALQFLVFSSYTIFILLSLFFCREGDLEQYRCTFKNTP